MTVPVSVYKATPPSDWLPAQSSYRPSESEYGGVHHTSADRLGAELLIFVTGALHRPSLAAPVGGSAWTNALRPLPAAGPYLAPASSNAESRTLVVVSALDPAREKELVVAEDGSIPADQLARLGLQPGAHLRVVDATSMPVAADELEGSLSDLPELEWEDFERGSELARRDLTGA